MKYPYGQSRWYRERNAAILRDHRDGMPIMDLVMKYNLMPDTVTGIISYQTKIEENNETSGARRTS